MKKILLLLIGIMFSLNLFTTFVCADFEIPFTSDSVGLYSVDNNDDIANWAKRDGTALLNNALLDIVNWFRVVLWVFAVMWITYYGLKMVISREETDFTNARKSIMIIIGALLASFLVEPVIRNVIYGWGKDLIAGEAILNPEDSVRHGINEIMWLMGWLKILIGTISVVMIIFTGVQSMFNFWDEDGLSKQKDNIKWIIIGILLITFNEIIVRFGIYWDPRLEQVWDISKVSTVRDAGKIISEATGFIGFILSLVAVFAFSGIVYGWFLMLGPNSDDTQKDEWKKIIKFVATWLVIIFVSYTIISTLIMFRN